MTLESNTANPMYEHMSTEPPLIKINDMDCAENSGWVIFGLQEDMEDREIRLKCNLPDTIDKTDPMEGTFTFMDKITGQEVSGSYSFDNYDLLERD